MPPTMTVRFAGQPAGGPPMRMPQAMPMPQEGALAGDAMAAAAQAIRDYGQRRQKQEAAQVLSGLMSRAQGGPNPEAGMGVPVPGDGDAAFQPMDRAAIINELLGAGASTGNPMLMDLGTRLQLEMLTEFLRHDARPR